MIPIEALESALSKEVETIELYEKFSAEYSVAKDTFLFLAGEEYKHKQLLEKKIHELGG